MAERRLNIKKNANFCEFKIQTALPPVIFNLLTYSYEIETNEYEWEFRYKTHGMWFMILGAILPLIFKSIPFDWKEGLGIGFAAGMVFNLLSWLFFEIKMKRCIKIIEEKYY